MEMCSGIYPSVDMEKAGCGLCWQEATGGQEREEKRAAMIYQRMCQKIGYIGHKHRRDCWGHGRLRHQCRGDLNKAKTLLEEIVKKSS